MSYEPNDEAWDEFYASVSEELYPGHKLQAISEFTRERLRSFYLQNPKILMPAMDMYYESGMLHKANRPIPTVVFCMTTLELLLKAALLRPIVYGLVHNDGLAGLIVEHTLGQTGFHRYKGLLAKIFEDFTGVDISTIKRSGCDCPLLDEALELQKLRNRIIHQGASCDTDDAERANEIVTTAFDFIVSPILQRLNIIIKPGENGLISGA